jgi:RNA polymerase sigma-70 factor (ECF subfamily)
VEPVDFLFRHESGRMISVLTRIFGFHNLALAEDVVQDAFCQALEVWKFRGMPDDPSAWLMATAKRRAIDVLRRERTARVFAPELERLAESEWTLVPAVEERFAPRAIQDDLLRMMFSCCDTRLKEEAQVALILHILCGFSVAEVAGRAGRGHGAVEKRLGRAKKVLAGSRGPVRDCDRTSSPPGCRPSSERSTCSSTRAITAPRPRPSCAASCAARRSGSRACSQSTRRRYARHARTPRASCACTRRGSRRGSMRRAELQTLFEQERGRWDRSLLAEGQRWSGAFSDRARTSPTNLVEAAIAWVHGQTAQTAEATDWARIVALYDQLMAIRPSPVVALNRAIADRAARGPERGLAEIRAIDRCEKLERYPFHPAALGELELRCGRATLAREHFKRPRARAQPVRAAVLRAADRGLRSFRSFR